MKDKVFININILIYLYSEDESEKQQIAEDLSNQLKIINPFLQKTKEKSILL